MGILGALLVSALGSGLWESLFAPVLHTVSRWTLDVLSLGLKSYKDGVYQQVALDNQSRPALEALFLITIIYSIINLAAFLFAMVFVPESDSDSGNKAPPGYEIMIRLTDGRWYRRIILTFAVIVPVLAYSQCVKFNYISSADAHYHQVLRIASPYLDATERTQSESDFAQISARNDYVRVLSSLEARCRANGRTVPKFDPW